jgi:hypothetical protein
MAASRSRAWTGSVEKTNPSINVISVASPQFLSYGAGDEAVVEERVRIFLGGEPLVNAAYECGLDRGVRSDASHEGPQDRGVRDDLGHHRLLV